MPSSNPYNATDHVETYYGEFVDAIPFRSLVNLLAYNLPRPIAWSIVACQRLKSWCGMPTLPTAATAEIGSAIRLPSEHMPARPMSRWAAKMEQACDLGFEPIEFCVNVHIGAKESASVLLLDRHQTSFLTFEWFRMPGADGIEERIAIEFNSLLTSFGCPSPREHDGEVPVTEVTTILSRKDERALEEAFNIDGVDLEFLPNTQPLRKAYQDHRDRLQKHSMRSIEKAKASAAYRELETKRLQWMVAKGLLRKLTPKQIELVKRNVLEVS